MKTQAFHLSDQLLLRQVDGELNAGEEKLVRSHLATCWMCRVRRCELESAISDFVHSYREVESAQPAPDGPRALLKARLAAVSAEVPNRGGWMGAAWAGVAVAILMLAGVVAVQKRNTAGHNPVVVSAPDARLTPGAAILTDPQQLCREARLNNKTVPKAVARQVFEEYGIAGNEPRAYEVDYLITPALGGADDIHNLWPHSYSATVWNARVKDALEDRLHQLVCEGSVDLTTAQREIAQNWIATYKQYFHTDKPLN